MTRDSKRRRGGSKEKRCSHRWPLCHAKPEITRLKQFRNNCLTWRIYEARLSFVDFQPRMIMFWRVWTRETGSGGRIFFFSKDMWLESFSVKGSDLRVVQFSYINKKDLPDSDKLCPSPWPKCQPFFLCPRHPIELPIQRLLFSCTYWSTFPSTLGNSFSSWNDFRLLLNPPTSQHRVSTDLDTNSNSTSKNTNSNLNWWKWKTFFAGKSQNREISQTHFSKWKEQMRWGREKHMFINPTGTQPECIFLSLTDCWFFGTGGSLSTRCWRKTTVFF